MTKKYKHKTDAQLKRESFERSEAGEPDIEYEDYVADQQRRKRHSEMCLRFGVAVGCPVCDYTGSRI